MDGGMAEQGLGMGGMGFKDLLAITRFGRYFNLANLSNLIGRPYIAGGPEPWSCPAFPFCLPYSCNVPHEYSFLIYRYKTGQ